MSTSLRLRHVLGCTSAALLVAAATVVARGTDPMPLALDTARVSLSGSSNIHEYTASTTTVRLTRVQLASDLATGEAWNQLLKPGTVQAFELAIPVATLSSPKDGLNKNMYKALKADQYADITFRLVRLEPGAAGVVKAVGVLRITGTEREIAMDLKTQRKDATLTVKGELPLLMTDFGIKPPTAMLGMLKTDPKVTVTIEAVLSVPLT